MKNIKKAFGLWACLLTLLGFFSPLVNAYASEKVGDGNFDKPFAMLLLGIDSGGQGRTEKGRTDVMMLATVNPNTEVVTLTSIPRDTYVEIPGHGKDKINHAYAFGDAELSQKTVQAWLGIDVPYYVTVDMTGIEEIVNLVGGVEVTPPSTFEIGGYTFSEGVPTVLDGSMALAYARERYNSGGDYARQERQRQLILAIVEASIAQVSDLSSAMKLATTMDKYVDTNIPLLKIPSLILKHKDMAGQIDFYQFAGTGVTLDGVYYDEIDPTSYDENLAIIKQNLELN